MLGEATVDVGPTAPPLKHLATTILYLQIATDRKELKPFGQTPNKMCFNLPEYLIYMVINFTYEIDGLTRRAGNWVSELVVRCRMGGR